MDCLKCNISFFFLVLFWTSRRKAATVGITNGDPKNLFFKCVHIVILVYLWFQICKVLQLLIKVGYLFLASHLGRCMYGWTLVLTCSPAHLCFTVQKMLLAWWSPSLLQWLFLFSSSVLLLDLLITKRRKVSDSNELMVMVCWWSSTECKSELIWTYHVFWNICFFSLLQKAILNHVSSFLCCSWFQRHCM